MPTDPDGVDLAELLSRPFAHRGWHTAGGAVENTLEAVEAAVVAGLAVEVDVALSADGVAVLHHDFSLQRVTGINRPVRALTLKQLANLNGAVPTAQAAVELVTGRAPLMLDLKCRPRKAERWQLAREVARLTEGFDGPVACVGFDPLALAAVGELAPWIIRGQSAGVPLGPRTNAWAKPITRPFDRLWFAPISRPHFISYNVDRISAPAATNLRDRFPVIGWTVKCCHRLAELTGSLDQLIVEDSAVQPASRCAAAISARSFFSSLP